MPETFRFSIDVPIRSEWANIGLLRSSVLSCFTAVFSDIDGCHALAMVTGELLENAIKYGDWSGEGGGSFRLRVWGDVARPGTHGHEAHVQVENPVRPSDPHVAAVRSTIDWIAGFPSAKEAYRARLLEIAAARDESNPSRLGLVRIAYEGNCSLRAEVVDGVLRVTADSVF